MPKKATEISELARTLPQMIADLSRGMAFIAKPGASSEPAAPLATPVAGGNGSAVPCLKRALSHQTRPNPGHEHSFLA